MDEVIFLLSTTTTSTWYQKGKEFLLPANLSREKIIEMGAIEPLTGESFHLFIPFTTQAVFREFIKELSKAFPEDEIILVHDGASWHNIESPVDNIELLKLPKYSPELNPIEHLWKWIKKNYLHNRFFESIEDLEKVLIEVFQNEELLKKAIKSNCSLKKYRKGIKT